MATTRFLPPCITPFVHCLDEGRRYGNIRDFERLVRVTHQLDGIHHLGHVICEPVDVPVNKRHLDMVRIMMTQSDKPLLGAITERVRAEDSCDMAKIWFGEETFNNNTVIMGNVNLNSPMLIDQVVANAIEVYCGQGQGIVGGTIYPPAARWDCKPRLRAWPRRLPSLAAPRSASWFGPAPRLFWVTS